MAPNKRLQLRAILNLVGAGLIGPEGRLQKIGSLTAYQYLPLLTFSHFVYD